MIFIPFGPVTIVDPGGSFVVCNDCKEKVTEIISILDLILHLVNIKSFLNILKTQLETVPLHFKKATMKTNLPRM